MKVDDEDQDKDDMKVEDEDEDDVDGPKSTGSSCWCFGSAQWQHGDAGIEMPELKPESDEPQSSSCSTTSYNENIDDLWEQKVDKQQEVPKVSEERMSAFYKRIQERERRATVQLQ